MFADDFVLSRGRGKFRVMACFDRNGRPFLSFMIASRYRALARARALFVSYARLKSCRVKSTSIVRVPTSSRIHYRWNMKSLSIPDMYSLTLPIVKRVRNNDALAAN